MKKNLSSSMSPSLLIGLLLSGMFVIMTFLAFLWTPHNVLEISVADRLQAPSFRHLFGTDHFGRDVFSMIMVGGRVSLAVALLSVGIGAAIGIPLGLLAAARGGWISDIILRGNDVIFAFPSILMALLLAAVMGPGVSNAILAVGLFNIPVFARLVNGAASSLWTREFVLAARAMGKSSARISIDHILPNLISLIIIQMTIQFSVGIIAEAGLSYIGVGAQPPTPSWGRMLNDAQTMLSFAPWLAIFPGLSVVITVMGLNLLGDGLRDILDPDYEAHAPDGALSLRDGLKGHGV